MIHFSRKIGGFGLPFYVIGIAVTLLAPFNFFLIPPLESNNISSKTTLVHFADVSIIILQINLLQKEKNLY